VLVPLGEPRGEPRVVEAADGRRFAVFPDGEDGFRVTDAECPHNRGPLEQGRLQDGVLTCPWHWYRFDVETGHCTTTRRYRLGVYPVVRGDGAWFADVGEAPVAMSWAERLRAHARGLG
jgi:nitrite reductase/ring-hydroxylating ferredoxin subunit